jgi:DNA-binding transcriptional LysR family regulator
MDRLDAMRIFVAVAVARLGSFVEAARQLQLSPSVVTRAVAQLEERLGLTLLGRTTRSLRLTERGEVYLESCRQILADVEGAERRVRGEDAAPCGELTVAAPIVFGQLHVLPIVERLLSEHRTLTIRFALSDRLVHLVEDGVDVAVRIGDLADSSLIAVTIGTVSRVVVAGPAYLAQHGVPTAPAMLARHDCIAFENVDATNEWRFRHGIKPVQIAPRLALNSADAAIAAAEAGIGIIRTLSYQVREAVSAGRLVVILQDFAPPASPVQIVYPARRIASANVAVFVKTAREHFKANALVPVEDW